MKYIFILLSLVIAVNALAKSKLSEEELQKITVKLRLSEMRARDQTVREELNRLAIKFGFSKMTKFFDYMRAIDIDNTEKLKALIFEYGWPGISQYGRVADNNAWLIVQHADHDVAFQEECLNILRAELTNHNTRPENYAYLYDRVMVNKNQLQKYGTQGTCIGHYKWQARPIEDEKLVDVRRQKMNLTPMVNYIKQASKLCP